MLHATDEIVTEFAIELYAADAPLHVVALRTPDAKYAVYSNWAADGHRAAAPTASSASSTTTARAAAAWRSTTSPAAARLEGTLQALLMAQGVRAGAAPAAAPQLRRAPGRGGV